MSDNKRYTTEWSFDLGTLRDQVQGQVEDWAKAAGLTEDTTVKQSTFTEPLAGATRARVTLDFSVGQARLHALTNDHLLEADVTHVGEVKFAAQRPADDPSAPELHLYQAAAPKDWFRNVVGWLGSGGRLHWDVGLTPHIPLELTIKGGAGTCEFDLQRVQVTELRLHGGVGEQSIILPSGAYHARIDGGVGKLDLVIPYGAIVTLEINAGAGEVTLSLGEQTAVTGQITGGVGAVTVRLAKDSAVRVEAERGLGGVSIGGGLVAVDGTPNLWQTPDYDTAAAVTRLHYRGGVGAFSVR